VIEGRGLLGDERAVGAVGGEQDRRRQPDPLGHGRGRGQRDERLVVAIDDAVDRAEAREATRLGAPRPLQQLVWLDAGDGGGQADSNVHDCSNRSSSTLAWSSCEP
jgi:hypothetical protein